MKSFDECLIKFNTKIEEFIKEYELLDDKHPFTLDIIKEISKIYQENYDSSTAEVSTYEKRKNKLDDSFKKTLNEFFKVERQRKNELREKKNKIKAELDEKINYAKLELAEVKKQYEKNEYETLNDINFFIDSSYQNIDMFEIEYKDNINRFSYQIDVAKTSYNSNIDTFNSQLESQLERVKEEYERNIEQSQQNFNSLVESYNLVIAEKNQLIENKKKEYNEAKSELNNKKRQEYVSLNNQIRQFSEEKNDKITNYKNIYLEAQNKDNNEKEKNNKEYKIQNFKANKDFVQNINELDNRIREIREQFDDYCQELNQNKYYNIYDLHVEQEKLIKQFINDEKDDKKIKREIKKINKLFYDRVIEEDKKTEKIIKSAEKDFLLNTKKEMYQKKLLDISRNTFFNKLSEKQTRDNKYYQEKSNGYEEIYNYNSSLATNEYNKNANKVILDSSIRNLEIEKEIDETDAKFQIQIETLTDVIKKYQLEIRIAKRLNDLNILYLTEKYNREVSYLTVSNLLKIEKCKVLDLYNINQYELNIKNSKNILDYSESKIKIQNDKYKALKQHDILIQNKQLDNLISKSSFDDYSVNHFAKTDEELLDKEFGYNTNVNKINLLNQKYIIELDEYQNVLQSFIIIYSNMVKSWNDIIDYIYDSITETNNKIVTHFIKTLETKYKELLNDLNDTYKEMVSTEINSHIKFNNDFRYQESFDNINKNIKAEIGILRRQRDSLREESEKYKQRNEDLRLKIYTSQYDKTAGKRENRSNNRLRVKELKNNLIVINELDNKILELEKEAIRIQKKYDKQSEIVQNERAFDNAPYQLFNDNVSKHYEEIKNFINKNEDDDTLSVKANIKKKIPFLTSIINEGLFNNTSIFSIKYQENHSLSLQKMEEKYNSELNLFKKNNSEKYERAKAKFNKNNQTELNIIKNLIVEKNKLEEKYNSTIEKNDLNHKKEISEILLAKKQNTNQFYNELYAVDDNLTDIEKDYYAFIKSHDEKYEINKQNIIDETIRTKDGYNEALKNYISNRKAIINHLPSAIKANEKDLIDNYKQKEKEIDLKVVQEKKELVIKTRQEKKNLNAIESNYANALVKLDVKERIQRTKEKKSLTSELAKAN